MAKYRKIPVEVEAKRLTRETIYEVGQWCGGKIYEDWGDFDGYLIIPTLEGEMRAEYGDYIICGVAGEFYPCKADIFEQTYELVPTSIY